MAGTLRHNKGKEAINGQKRLGKRQANAKVRTG